MQNETDNTEVMPTAGPIIPDQRYTTVDMDMYTPYTPTEFDLSPELTNAFVPCIIFTLTIGLVGNLLAVFITYSCAKENNENRLTIPAILTRALLATDISATVFFLIRGMLLFVYNDTWIQCDLDLTSNLIFSWVSGLVNMLMSCDRCLALGTPFFYHTYATRTKTYVALAIAVLVATLVSFLPVMGFGAYKVYIDGEYHCLAPGDLQANATLYDFHFNALFFILGLGVIVVIYASNAVVMFHLLKLKKRLVVVADYERTKPLSSTGEDGDKSLNMSMDASRCAPGNGSVQPTPQIARTEVLNRQRDPFTVDNVSTIDLKDDRDNSRPVVRLRVKSSTQRHTNSGKTEMRFGAMILVFSLVFSLSWLPFYIQRLMKAFSSSTSNVVLVIVIYLLTLNHVIDPFVYVLMKRQYRQKLVKLSRRWRSLLCRCCGRGNEAIVSDVRSVSSAVDANGQGREHLCVVIDTQLYLRTDDDYTENSSSSTSSAQTTLTVVTESGQGTLSRQTDHQKKSNTPQIQVTAASPSLASECSHLDDHCMDVNGTDANASSSFGYPSPGDFSTTLGSSEPS